MNRRPFLLGTLAAGAAVGGVALAVWQRRGPGDGTASLWEARFQTPEGSTLAMSSLRGKPLLLNFWATWCPPCIIEMPLLDAFAATRTDWNVLALAVDAADPVRRFMSERRLRLLVALAPETGLELGRQLGNLAGGLPFSIAFTAAGTIATRKLGAVDDQLLQGWANSIR